MPVHIMWFDSHKRSIRMHFSPSWKWDDFHAAIKHINTLLDDAPVPVDVIIDFTNGSVMPTGAIQHLRRIVTQCHPNRNRVIMVGAKHYTRAFERGNCQNFNQISASLILVDTLDEAIATVRQINPDGFELATTI
jgi:hypothetical protein